jgi:hypothetical protein
MELGRDGGVWLVKGVLVVEVACCGRRRVWRGAIEEGVGMIFGGREIRFGKHAKFELHMMG